MPNVHCVSLHRIKLTHSLGPLYRQNRRKTRDTRNVCLPCQHRLEPVVQPISVGHKGEGSPEATLPRRPTPSPALSLNSQCPGTLVLPVLCPRAPTLPLRELIRKAHCSPAPTLLQVPQPLAKSQEEDCDLVNGRKPRRGAEQTWVLWAGSPLLPSDLLGDLGNVA